MKQMLQPVLFSCCNSIFSGMLRAYWRFLSLSLVSLSSLQFTSFLNRVSFSRLKKLRIESIPKTPARASLVVRGPAFFVSLPNFSSGFDLIAMAGLVGGGFRSCALPKECRAFFPKTTASWLYMWKLLLLSFYVWCFNRTLSIYTIIHMCQYF